MRSTTIEILSHHPNVTENPILRNELPLKIWQRLWPYRRTRLLYVALLDGSLVLGSLCALSRPWAALVLVAGLMAGPSVRRVLAGAEGPDLVDVLARTGRIQMTAGALLALGLALSA